MRILLALGGNALLPPSGADFNDYHATVKATASSIAKLVKAGHKVAITHGNGPQVGNRLLQQEACSETPRLPLDVLGAETQGQIGYMLQKELRNALPSKETISIVTQVVVDAKDEAFSNPTKSVGPFYDVPPGRPGWTVRKIGQRWRRVVPSPKPVDIIEKEAIKEAHGKGIVIACGGGGIPVIRHGGRLEGVEGVIDKDLAGAIMASLLDVDLFLMLTDVDGVHLNHGKADQTLLRRMAVKDAKRLLEGDELGEGSMRPKVQAAVNFVSKTGKSAIIASLKDMQKAVEGKAGTIIV